MEAFFKEMLVHLAFISILFISVLAVIHGLRKPHYFSVICFAGTFLFAASYYVLTLMNNFLVSAIVFVVGLVLIGAAAFMNGRAPGVRRRKIA